MPFQTAMFAALLRTINRVLPVRYTVWMLSGIGLLVALGAW